MNHRTITRRTGLLVATTLIAALSCTAIDTACAAPSSAAESPCAAETLAMMDAEDAVSDYNIDTVPEVQQAQKAVDDAWKKIDRYEGLNSRSDSPFEPLSEAEKKELDELHKSPSQLYGNSLDASNNLESSRNGARHQLAQRQQARAKARQDLKTSRPQGLPPRLIPGVERRRARCGPARTKLLAITCAAGQFVRGVGRP
ncbi:hypothetical protein [Nocardia sp. NPDC050175]|uniref:hypothetical protein n=1 Tax=Nocardia sp. NPDC050175 TaxID=3364317 RepID=UPI0037AD278E